MPVWKSDAPFAAPYRHCLTGLDSLPFLVVDGHFFEFRGAADQLGELPTVDRVGSSCLIPPPRVYVTQWPSSHRVRLATTYNML